MLTQLKKGGYWSLLIFVSLFIITTPFHYSVLPNTGKWFIPFSEEVSNWFISEESVSFYSDSTVMVVWTLVLLVFSGIIGLLLMLLNKKISATVVYLVEHISAYYLALMLLIYGFNKVFNYQFYFPEPNILFTPVGQLSPDILYWSTMGTSYSYSLFAGLIEVIPALLLLFKRTRLLGACIAFAVLTNVLMVNVGFGITVKLQSAFFMLLSIIIIAPNLKRLWLFFTGKPVPPLHENIPLNSSVLRIRPYAKWLLVGLIFVESLFVYVDSGVFNGHNQLNIPHHGAYALQPNQQHLKHAFFHSANYFILQNEKDAFFDFKMQWKADTLLLTDYDSTIFKLASSVNANTMQLHGNFYGDTVNWELTKINLSKLPVRGEAGF